MQTYNPEKKERGHTGDAYRNALRDEPLPEPAWRPNNGPGQLVGGDEGAGRLQIQLHGGGRRLRECTYAGLPV